MKRALAIGALVLAYVAGAAHAKGKKPADDAEDEVDATDDDAPKAKAKAADDDAGDDDDDRPKKKPKKGGDDDASQQDRDAQKQDLNGHDLGTKKKENEFEKDRFYVDKSDTAKTEKGTLVQGSIASSSFLYTESGGNYPGAAAIGSDAAKFSRYFTDLRLQTDFRHIGAGRWDARLDARLRVVNTAADVDPNSADKDHVQSGFNGTNEYDLRELWLIRNGVRSDVTIGRQYIADLAAVKIDGVRVDYASSRQLTFLGFGGLYPVRGSRSLTTDYVALKDSGGASAGKLVGAGGFGAAYRTLDAYGSIGGVALVPLQAESPRVFATSNGYFRVGPTLDVYHFALVDLIAQSGANLTNLSAGVNYKPNQRLRLTAAFNRVDTDTLNVQAQAFLDPANATGAAAGVVQNETFIKRLSTNQARAGLSAALGQLQRFEISTAVTYRYRPDVTLTGPGATPTTVTLPAAKGVDVYASIVDRHSIKDLRLGLDVSRTFAVGTVAYQRSEVLAVRASAAHDIRDGRGEWEAELAYATTKDLNAGMACASIDTCFGSTTNKILSLGGNLYYRLNADWFALASLSLSRQATTTLQNNMTQTDPSITGLTGFFRIAYRF